MKFRIFRSLAKSKSDAPIGINRSIRCLFISSLSLSVVLITPTSNAETARADNLSIKIDTSGYYFQYEDQNLELYAYYEDDPWNPIVRSVQSLTAPEGDTYLFVIVDELGSCGHIAYLATVFDNEIRNLKLPGCGAWSVVQPDTILAYDSIWGMCGRDGSKASRAHFPVSTRVGGYSDKGVSIERLSVYEALKVNRLEIAFQQAFDSAQRGIDLSKVTEIDELLFCESLTEDVSIASKYELLLGAWPNFGETYDMQSQ